MADTLRDGQAQLATPTGGGIPLEIAASRRARNRGLLGRDHLDGALLISPCNSVHTLRMRFAIDVAYLTKDMRVIDVHTLAPNRLGRPRLRARHVLEAPAGAMNGWDIVPNSQLHIAL